MRLIDALHPASSRIRPWTLFFAHPCLPLAQAEAHPDRHGTAEAAAQQAIADHASEITDAYAVLKAPHSRATHLLELLGAPLDEDTGGEVLGPGFLMQVMEVREELEEAGSRTEVLRDLLEANQASIAELLEQLIPAFDDAAAADLERARMLTAQLQYLNKIDEEITKRLPVE